MKSAAWASYKAAGALGDDYGTSVDDDWSVPRCCPDGSCSACQEDQRRGLQCPGCGLFTGEWEPEKAVCVEWPKCAEELPW
jgi:hypothetical protein